MFTYSVTFALLICVSSYVKSQECLTYNFEENFYEFFSSCGDDSEIWSTGFYEDLGIESPHPLSTTFIKPGQNGQRPSCVSSGTFPVRADGKFEIQAYMKSASGTEQIIVIVFGEQEEENDATLGVAVLSAAVDGVSGDGFYNFEVNWSVSGDKMYNGYVKFQGVASEESILLVDSFRYIPPGVDSESCSAYDDAESPDPGSSTPVTDDPGSSSPITDDPGFSSPITDDPESSSPITDDPGYSTPVTDDPGSSTPVTDDPGSSSPITDGPEFSSPTTVDPESSSPTTVDPDSSSIITDGPEIDPITEGPGTDSPDVPSASPDQPGVDPIWKTLAIVFASLLSFTILGLICWSFYECGKRRVQKQTPQELFMTDYDNLPKPITMPRVARAFNDTSSIYNKNQ
ncbi:unnamed protein product [Plutella xylostella]|uniref:(diamondback moth) hypothetical protein n=1 Tax=Plutella xylostella TaxID=51655 RepID=A0A8S4G090_PLUXY|nr:unnamed protein product [Plutella xylostella]